MAADEAAGGAVEEAAEAGVARAPGVARVAGAGAEGAVAGVVGDLALHLFHEMRRSVQLKFSHRSSKKLMRTQSGEILQVWRQEYSPQKRSMASRFLHRHIPLSFQQT